MVALFPCLLRGRGGSSGSLQWSEFRWLWAKTHALELFRVQNEIFVLFASL